MKKLSKGAERKARVLQYLDVLVAAGMSLPSLERRLGLPAKSLSDDKTLRDEATLPLVRLITHMPWLIDVAEFGFDKKMSNLLLRKAVTEDEISKRMEELAFDR